MKRSDMQAKIADNVLINFMPNVALQMRMLIADCVLSEAEKAGMSPPDEDGSVFGWNEGFISPPEWGPENE